VKSRKNDFEPIPSPITLYRWKWFVGLELFKQCEAHIVLMDINMPVMESILMAREIRML
jgi:hypothetical protein